MIVSAFCCLYVKIVHLMFINLSDFNKKNYILQKKKNALQKILNQIPFGFCCSWRKKKQIWVTFDLWHFYLQPGCSQIVNDLWKQKLFGHVCDLSIIMHIQKRFLYYWYLVLFLHYSGKRRLHKLKLWVFGLPSVLSCADLCQRHYGAGLYRWDTSVITLLLCCFHLDPVRERARDNKSC